MHETDFKNTSHARWLKLLDSNEKLKLVKKEREERENEN